MVSTKNKTRIAQGGFPKKNRGFGKEGEQKMHNLGGWSHEKTVNTQTDSKRIQMIGKTQELRLLQI